MRRVLWRALWAASLLSARFRRRRPGERTVGRHVYRDQTRRMGVVMTETLRERYRRRWLRLRR